MINMMRGFVVPQLHVYTLSAQSVLRYQGELLRGAWNVFAILQSRQCWVYFLVFGDVFLSVWYGLHWMDCTDCVLSLSGLETSQAWCMSNSHTHSRGCYARCPVMITNPVSIPLMSWLCHQEQLRVKSLAFGHLEQHAGVGVALETQKQLTSHSRHIYSGDKSDFTVDKKINKVCFPSCFGPNHEQNDCISITVI